MIVVFCKYYNDLDQIVPVVYALARHGRKDIEMVLLDPAYDLESDFRIAYLKREFDIAVSYYHKDCCAGRLKPFLLMDVIYGPVGIFLMGALVQLGHLGGAKIQKKIETRVRRFPGKLARKWYGTDYAKCFLKKRKVSVIVSDNRPRPVQLYKMAKAMGIPVVGIPHGMNTAADNAVSSRQIALKQSGAKPSFPHDLYHVFATQYNLEKERYIEQKTPSDKVQVLGSTRYCPEWRNVYKTILPPAIICDATPNKRNLRVVFMDHSTKYQMQADEIVRNIKAILDLDFVDFVLKPSTGKMTTKLKPDSDHATQEILGICRLASQEHSYNLIEWADVVMIAHSSILLEVLLQGKTFLYPKHFTELTGLFEEYEACWQVNSQEELIEALYKSHENPQYRPYSQKAVEDMCEMMVFGHQANRDVLGDHRDLILAAEQNITQNAG